MKFFAAAHARSALTPTFPTRFPFREQVDASVRTSGSLGRGTRIASLPPLTPPGSTAPHGTFKGRRGTVTQGLAWRNAALTHTFSSTTYRRHWTTFPKHRLRTSLLTAVYRTLHGVPIVVLKCCSVRYRHGAEKLLLSFLLKDSFCHLRGGGGIRRTGGTSFFTVLCYCDCFLLDTSAYLARQPTCIPVTPSTLWMAPHFRCLCPSLLLSSATPPGPHL